MAEVDEQWTKEGDNKKNEKEKQVNGASSLNEELSAIARNNEMEQKSEITFEKQVNGASSSTPTIVVEDILSSGKSGRSENSLPEITGGGEDVVKNVVVKSVKIESYVSYIEKESNDFVRLENGMEENAGTVLGNLIHDDTTATNIEEDKSRRVSKGIENNNVDTDVKDDLKKVDLSSRENGVGENSSADIEEGLNDDSVNLTQGHDNEIEQIPEITFENILVVEDWATSNSKLIIEDVFTSGRIEIQEDFKDDDVGSKEWVQIESNLAYIGKEDDSLEQNDSEVEKTAGTAIESYEHSTNGSNSQTIENSLTSKEQEDAESTTPDFHINDEVKGDLKSREYGHIVLTDTDVQKKKDDLDPRECAKVENNGQTVDTGALISTEGELIGDDTDDNLLSLQLQHEREMQELRANLQDEYQNQVLKISDELREHYQNDMDEKIAKLEEDWELEFARQKREFDEQVSAVQREQWMQCQEAIERVTLDAEDQLKSMKHSYERETAEHKQRIKELLEREELWEIKEKELANEKSEKENESTSKIKKLENQLSFEREEIESQLSSAQDEIKALKKQHQSETENLTNELDKKYSDILDEMRKELKSKYQDEMDHKVNQVECHLREQYEQDLEKTKEEVQQSTSTLKTKYEKQVADVLSQLEELHERNQEHELREARLKEKFESEKTKVAELLNEVERKTQMVDKLEQNKEDLKALEEKYKQCLNERCELEEKVKGYSESMPKETVDLQEELARKSNEMQALDNKISDGKTNDICEELEVKLQEMTIEKQSLEQQLVDSKLEITSLQEKLKEDENIEKELKSNYDTKILQTTRNFEEEVKALENELKLKKSSEEEISKLKEELQKHKVTISELEETSRGREIEIANLILNSPSPHGLTDQEFDFSVNSDDRAQVLENELAKYKKKVQELEEEAEDKFETSLCPNCQDREKSEEILIQTKAFVEKIQLDCEKKVQSVSEDLGKMENALNEQIGESKDLKAKLEKAEEDLREERKRSLEISNIGKHFDVNRNVLGLEGADEQMVALEPVQSVLDQEDGKTQIDDNTSDPSNKDVGSLFDEQEKFYKNEVLKKDEEISRLITENEKTQQQIQNLKEKLDEGKAQFEQLKIRTLEQKTKYENEINLMQKEIEILIQENKEVKDQLKALQHIQSETENLARKLQESENVVQGKVQETTDLNEKLQETEKMLKQNSSKYEQEIVNLKEVVQEKENVMSDLRNSLDLLEKSREGLELDISNQKQEFSKRERSLLNEISEMTIAFEDEKAKILEDGFLDKEEMKQKVHGLEMLIHEYNFNRTEHDIGGYEGLDGDIIPQEWTSNSNEKWVDSGDWNNVPEERAGDGDTFQCEPHKTRNIRGYEWSNVDEKATRGTGVEMVPASNEKVKYEEINYYPSENFNHRDETQSDDDDGVLKEGTEGRIQEDGEHKQELLALPDLKRQVLKDKYALFDDTEFDDPFRGGSPESLYSDEKYKEIACEENLELLKYEHDIDLLLARKENERLRAEIGTLTDCVDVFHDECDSLKRSLDKTVKMVGILRDERDELMKKHNVDMAEHSELVLDLIKYEDTIGRLERGNEKLEEDRKLLEECLMGKQTMLSRELPNEDQAGLSYNPHPKTESTFALQNDRREEYGRKLLGESPVEKETMLFQESPSERQFAKFLYDPKSKTSYPIQARHMKSLQERRTENQALFPNSAAPESSMQLGSEVDPFLPNDSLFLKPKIEHERNETDFLRNRDKYEKDDAHVLGKHDVLEGKEGVMLEDLVKEAELERTFGDELLSGRTKDMKMYGQDENKKSIAHGIEMQFAKDNQQFHDQGAFGVGFARTLPSMERIEDVKTQTQDEKRHRVSQDNKPYSFKDKSNTESVSYHNQRNYKKTDTSPQYAKTESSRLFSPKYRYEAETSSKLNTTTPQRYTKEMKSLRGTKLPRKTKIKNSPHSVNTTDRSSLVREKQSTKKTSKFKNGSMVFPRHEVSYNSHNTFEVMRNVTPSSGFTKRTGRNGIAERRKFEKSNSRNLSSKVKRVPGTFLSSASTPSSPNYSNSRILTSTRANLTSTGRLVPNLSGLSPIVSPLDRHYHAEKLRWRILEDERGNVTRANHDNTTFLLNIDPNELLHTPTSRTRTRSRSRSADDRLLTREMTLSHELYQEKPLLINFEDFICRHRVKSSENVANIRDPSPAELWFS